MSLALMGYFMVVLMRTDAKGTRIYTQYDTRTGIKRILTSKNKIWRAPYGLRKKSGMRKRKIYKETKGGKLTWTKYNRRRKIIVSLFPKK